MKEETPFRDKKQNIIFRGDRVQVDDDWDKYGWAAGSIGTVDKSPSSGLWCIITEQGRFVLDDPNSDYLTIIN